MDIAMVLSNFKQLIFVLLSISHVIWLGLNNTAQVSQATT